MSKISNANFWSDFYDKKMVQYVSSNFQNCHCFVFLEPKSVRLFSYASGCIKTPSSNQPTYWILYWGKKRPQKNIHYKNNGFQQYIGLVQKRQEYQNLYISYKKGLSVQHAAPRPAWPPPLSVGWCLFLSVYHWCTLMKSGDKVLHLSR